MGSPDHALERGDGVGARAAAGVATHVDAVAVGPLPERQPIRLAAVTDGGGRPEPAPLEAHPLRDETRDAAGARSGVLLRRGSHLHGVRVLCVHSW